MSPAARPRSGGEIGPPENRDISIVVGVTSIRTEVDAHVVSALDELGEVVDEVLDDALLVGHHRLVQRGVPVVIPRLGGV